MHGFNTLRFEATPEGSGPIAGLGPGGSPHEPAAEPEPQAEPEWQGVTQEDWEAQQALLQQTQEQLQALAPLTEAVQQMPQIGQQQQQGLGPPPDPTYDPEGFTAWLDQRDSERLGPLQNHYAEQQNQEGQARAMDIIADLTAGEDKGFLYEDSAKRARIIAEEYMPDAIQQYGPGTQAAEAALQQAVEDVRNWELEVGKAYAERQQQHLNTVSNAPGSLGTAGPVSGQAVVTTPGSFQDVIRKYQNQITSS